MHIKKTILDPIHGYIEIDEINLKILDSSIMQRLRNIKQLGFSNLVYPGANHTRFEHSLGVYFLVNSIINLGNIQLENKDTKNDFITASLLHDIGHGPFSHVTEKILEIYLHRKHDDVKTILLNDKLKDLLNDYGLNLIEIAKHINGKTSLSQILCSEIDLDKIDYLKRDMHYTGISSYNIGSKILLKNIMLINNKLVLSTNGIKAAESLLILRSLMNVSVYYHHVSRIAETMFLRASIDLIDNKIIKPNCFSLLDDISLVSILRSNSKTSPDSISSIISKRIDNRDLYKRAVYEGFNKIKDTDSIIKYRTNITKIENELSSIAGLNPGDILVDIPKIPQKIKMKSGIKEKGLNKLTDVSQLIKTIFKSESENWKFGIFTSKENIKKVNKVACEYFNLNF